jgi:hypothetical protein
MNREESLNSDPEALKAAILVVCLNFCGLFLSPTIKNTKHDPLNLILEN